jgi:hypothetical protein
MRVTSLREGIDFQTPSVSLRLRINSSAIFNGTQHHIEAIALARNVKIACRHVAASVRWSEEVWLTHTRGLMMVGIEFGSTCKWFVLITHGSAQIEQTRKYASFDRHLLLYAEWNGRI